MEIKIKGEKKNISKIQNTVVNLRKIHQIPFIIKDVQETYIPYHINTEIKV